MTQFATADSLRKRSVLFADESVVDAIRIMLSSASRPQSKKRAQAVLDQAREGGRRQGARGAGDPGAPEHDGKPKAKFETLVEQLRDAAGGAEVPRLVFAYDSKAMPWRAYTIQATPEYP